MKFLLIFIAFLIALFQTTVYAGVHKCVKANGAVFYSDRPCTSGQKEQAVVVDHKKKPMGVRHNSENQNQEEQLSQVEAVVGSRMQSKEAFEASIRQKEKAMDEGTYKPSESEAALNNKLTKHYNKLDAKFEAQRREKEALRKARKEEHDRKSKILMAKRDAARKKSRKAFIAQKKLADYKEYMLSRERSGAMMTEEEKEWRDFDSETLKKSVDYYTARLDPFSQESKDYDQSMRAAAGASARQSKIDTEFNNTRYQGNDINH